MLENTNNIKMMLTAFIAAGLIGIPMVSFLRKIGIGQSIREEGPETHFKKSGTPTMGGLIIYISLLLTSLLFIKDLLTTNTIIILMSITGFGLIGFIDDYLIVVRKDNQGLTAKQKIIGQTLMALALSTYQSQFGRNTTSLIIPFVKDNLLDLKLLYIPIMTFIIVGTVNSVNLTDGLDGLASGITSIVLIFFSLVANHMNQSDISYMSSILAGACLGFLIHNFFPAKVFMGDTGSLGLGGAVSSIAILLNLPLIIPIAGGVYFAEALSVIIQVASFQLTGKRVFLMSPLHHHFEEKGWKEKKVVLVFWLATLILCMIAYFSLI